MATPSLTGLKEAITAKIQAAQNAGGSLVNAATAVVLPEDTHDLATEINKKIGEIGMLILVGMPHFINNAKAQNPNVEADISCAIAIGENPAVWRVQNADGSTRPYAPDVALIVAQLMQNFKVDGFYWIRVKDAPYIPDKKRQLYEVSLETHTVVPSLNQ